MKKSRKIHLKNVCDLESINFGGEFQFNFFDYKKNLNIILHLPRWWIKIIAEKSWDIIKDEQKELDVIKDSMSPKN